jgi:hypothetical protein
MSEITIQFSEIAGLAGFHPEADGKLNLPATQQTADALSAAAITRLGGEWQPGDDRISVVLTGAGPVWGYLAIAHALHGRVVSLRYAAPNADIVVFSHGDCVPGSVSETHA